MAVHEASQEDTLEIPTGFKTSVTSDCVRFLIALAVFSSYALTAKLTSVPIEVVSVLAGYAIYSGLLLATSRAPFRRGRERIFVWLDLGWCGTLVAITGALDSALFLLFPFSILVASLRYGVREGRCITWAAASVYAISILIAGMPESGGWPKLALRCIFLLALGFVIAGWGGREAAFKKRLGFLKEVSRISNPRFGVDHTVSSLMDKLTSFFSADQCIVVVYTAELGAHFLRETSTKGRGAAIRARPCPHGAASTLLQFSAEDVVLYRGPPTPFSSLSSRRDLYNMEKNRWRRDHTGVEESIANILNTSSYIGVPIELNKSPGRLYIASRSRRYTCDDAVFLNQVSVQAFSVISHIEVLDRLASEAANHERRRIVLDLHDSTIQPYIGLKVGLEALRNKTSHDNPVRRDIDQLVAMASVVVDDLRSYVKHLNDSGIADHEALISGVLGQAGRFRDFYGIEIDVQSEGPIHINDRLAAEALQIISEGLHNIRKHTTAKRGMVRLACHRGKLLLHIQNEVSDRHIDAFTPRSITQRAAALGGRTSVKTASGEPTTISIEIPV